MQNVVIFGMHRSGTSMLASYLAGCGLSVGEPGDMMPTQDDNAAGFWERLDVVELNDRLLSAAGGSWFSPPLPMSTERESVDEKAKAIVAALPKPFVLKDPRMVLTWPLWQTALADSVMVYVYRSPMAVATSLQRRHGFPLTFGFALWEYYNRCALQHLANTDAIYLSYDAIAADPESSLSALLTTLSERGVDCSAPAANPFNSELNHAPHEDGTFHLLTNSQQALAQYCETLCLEQQAREYSVFDNEAALRCLLQDLSSAFEPLQDARSVRIHRDYLQAQSDACHQALDRLNDEHKALAQAFKSNEQESEKRVQALRKDLQGKSQQLDEVYTRLLKFEESPLGHVGRVMAAGYKLLTLRRGMQTSYDEALEQACLYLQSDGKSLPRKSQSKFSMLADVIRYVVRHPAGSLRSFSLARLRRAAAVFIKSSPDDLEVWVSSRFPEQETTTAAFDSSSLDEKFDDLILDFPAVSAPRVSIIVPVYNNYRMTMQCLQALLDNTGESNYEVIIADDASTDLTRSIAQCVKNIVVARSESNQGFLINCNQAAKQAKGEFVLFLNNDTAVCKGWLSALLALMDARPDAGVVGPKLLFGDGRLQEAGGIVWRDGSAWNFGRMDDPAKPAYNYVKSVDYISGACLMIRHELWRQLGGFDSRYAPAYYEDTDIAFAAREAGYQVLYQPEAKVFHFEGVSNGTDVGAGIKHYQVRNQQVFCERWRDALARDHFANAEQVFFARDRSRRQRSVLVIDHYVPHYDQDAGSRSTFMYIQLFLEMGYKVLFLGANYFPHQPYTKTLQQMGVEVLVGEYMARNQDRWLQENAASIDCVYLHRPHIAEQLLDSLEKMSPRPQIIYFGHDLHYLRVSRELDVSGDDSLRRSAQNWQRRELAVFDRVDKVYYPSQVEIDEVKAQRPQLAARAIPLYALGLQALPEYNFNATQGLLFVGGFNHPPNVDGICWFVEQVLPLLQQYQSDLHLHIVGSNPSDAVQDLQSEVVTVYGYLSDDELDALYRRTRLVVVPLRFGAGVKGKVLEAVQKSLPIVTTAIGAEGIPEASKVMTLADDAQGFAEAVLQLYCDEQRAREKISAYASWLECHFSKARAAEIVSQDFGPVQREDDKIALSRQGETL